MLGNIGKLAIVHGIVPFESVGFSITRALEMRSLAGFGYREQNCRRAPTDMVMQRCLTYAAASSRHVQQRLYH